MLRVYVCRDKSRVMYCGRQNTKYPLIHPSACPFLLDYLANSQSRHSSSRVNRVAMTHSHPLVSSSSNIAHRSILECVRYSSDLVDHGLPLNFHFHPLGSVEVTDSMPCGQVCTLSLHRSGLGERGKGVLRRETG